MSINLHYFKITEAPVTTVWKNSWLFSFCAWWRSLQNCFWWVIYCFWLRKGCLKKLSRKLWSGQGVSVPKALKRDGFLTSALVMCPFGCQREERSKVKSINFWMLEVEDCESLGNDPNSIWSVPAKAVRLQDAALWAVQVSLLILEETIAWAEEAMQKLARKD